MTVKEIENLKRQLLELHPKVDSGIFETGPFLENEVRITAGLSVETQDNKLVYIYNLFVDDDEYVNIGETGTSDFPLPKAVLLELIMAADYFKEVLAKHDFKEGSF